MEQETYDNKNNPKLSAETGNTNSEIPIVKINKAENSNSKNISNIGKHNPREQKSARG